MSKEAGSTRRPLRQCFLQPAFLGYAMSLTSIPMSNWSSTPPPNHQSQPQIMAQLMCQNQSPADFPYFKVSPSPNLSQSHSLSFWTSHFFKGRPPKFCPAFFWASASPAHSLGSAPFARLGLLVLSRLGGTTQRKHPSNWFPFFGTPPSRFHSISPARPVAAARFCPIPTLLGEGGGGPQFDFSSLPHKGMINP